MLDDTEDIDDSDKQLAHKLSKVLRRKLGTHMFNQLRDRLEATGVSDRIITLAIITEVTSHIQANQPVTIATRDTTSRLQVEVTDWRLVDEIETHGRLLDGPLFRT